jgi:hypothetical protein
MKPAVKEISRAFNGLDNPLALLLTCQQQIVSDSVVLLRQRDIVAFGKIFNGIGKCEILMLHYKTEDIAPASASEAVVELVIRIHLEGRGLLLVERAQPNVTIA